MRYRLFDAKRWEARAAIFTERLTPQYEGLLFASNALTRIDGDSAMAALAAQGGSRPR